MIDISEAVSTLCYAAQIEPNQVTRITITPGLMVIDHAYTLNSSDVEQITTLNVIVKATPVKDTK